MKNCMNKKVLSWFVWQFFDRNIYEVISSTITCKYNAMLQIRCEYNSQDFAIPNTSLSFPVFSTLVASLSFWYMFFPWAISKLHEYVWNNYSIYITIVTHCVNKVIKACLFYPRYLDAYTLRNFPITTQWKCIEHQECQMCKVIIIWNWWKWVYIH